MQAFAHYARDLQFDGLLKGIAVVRRSAFAIPWRLEVITEPTVLLHGGLRAELRLAAVEGPAVARQHASVVDKKPLS